MVKQTPCIAIRKFCRYYCANHNFKRWINCPNWECPLYYFRRGKRIYNEEERELKRQESVKQKEEEFKKVSEEQEKECESWGILRKFVYG